MERGAIVFLGDCGSGKSTTAAVFANLGYSVVADDIVALRRDDETYLVEPGHPRLCLWPETVAALYGSADALPKITHSWEKRFMGRACSETSFADVALPLRCVYLLGARETSGKAPRIEPVAPKVALMALVTNTYGNLLPEAAMHAKDLMVAAELVRSVPVRRLVPHGDPAKIHDITDVVLEDLRVLG